MRKAIYHTIRGFGYLPHCGHHPGLEALLFFLLMGGAAGATNGGWKGFLVGSSAMAAVMVPLAAIGAYERSVRDEELTAKELAQQKKLTP